MTDYQPENGMVTHGPWTAELEGANGNHYWRCFRICSGERLVAELDCSNGLGQGDANAAVLVQALALLEALERLVAAIQKAPDAIPDALTQADAVIARARSAKPV